MQEENKKLMKELKYLREEQEKLGHSISSSHNIDDITKKRMQRRKSLVDQQIITIEETMYPDIIA